MIPSALHYKCSKLQVEIFDELSTKSNWNNVFSLILVTAARNKLTGLGRSTASAVLLVFIFIIVFMFHGNRANMF